MKFNLGIRMDDAQNAYDEDKLELNMPIANTKGEYKYTTIPIQDITVDHLSRYLRIVIKFKTYGKVYKNMVEWIINILEEEIKKRNHEIQFNG